MRDYLEMVADGTNIAIANTESHIWLFDWYINLHLTLAHSKGHAHFDL